MAHTAVVQQELPELSSCVTQTLLEWSGRTRCGLTDQESPSAVSSSQGTLDFLEENRDDDICYYLFSLASRSVCGYELSVGDILLIM